MLHSSFPPLYQESTEILVLGSMPGQVSLDAQQYYANRQNLFWSFVFACPRAELPNCYDQRIKVLFDRHIGLWDVLKHCHREGSLDSAISRSSEVANDLEVLVQSMPRLKRLCFNGKKARQLFDRHILKAGSFPVARYELVDLPSTSPANAAMSFETKALRWRQALSI
ncbi:DNA-deoxyinosine glycosylase [Agaribacterium sp. ZY112]|uniref:DNA-deoxyinosine glycosylase n=1 Tax=Agaribacterium sp. ZY112 TaxID=3233574 RepID=UPI0035267883